MLRVVFIAVKKYCTRRDLSSSSRWRRLDKQTSKRESEEFQRRYCKVVPSGRWCSRGTNAIANHASAIHFEIAFIVLSTMVLRFTMSVCSGCRKSHRKSLHSRRTFGWHNACFTKRARALSKTAAYGGMLPSFWPRADVGNICANSAEAFALSSRLPCMLSRSRFQSGPQTRCQNSRSRCWRSAHL